MTIDDELINLLKANEENKEEPQQEQEQPKDEISILSIYRPECLVCGHLVSGAIKFFDKCHWQLGKNQDCPAQSLRIVIGVNYEAASTALAKALKEGDPELLLKVANKLASKDPLVVRRVAELTIEKL